MKKSKIVGSFRIDSEILENFKERCETLGVSQGYILQELMKDFIVRNINKQSHETASILPIKIKDLKELDENEGN
jgi:hypothetical protein